MGDVVGEVPDVEVAGRVRPRVWIPAILVVAVVVGLGVRQSLRTGTDPAALNAAFGFDIGRDPAIAEEDSRPAPSLEGPRLGGGSLALDDQRGSIVVLNLWASWCGPCRKEEPILQRLSVEYRAAGVRFLGVDIKDQEASAQAFQREFGVTYPSFFDRSGEIASQLGARVLPTTYVIDREGRIRLRLTGTIDEALLRQVLDGPLTSEGTDG